MTQIPGFANMAKCTPSIDKYPNWLMKEPVTTTNPIYQISLRHNLQTTLQHFVLQEDCLAISCYCATAGRLTWNFFAYDAGHSTQTRALCKLRSILVTGKLMLSAGNHTPNTRRMLRSLWPLLLAFQTHNPKIHPENGCSTRRRQPVGDEEISWTSLMTFKLFNCTRFHLSSRKTPSQQILSSFQQALRRIIYEKAINTMDSPWLFRDFPGKKERSAARSSLVTSE